MDIHRCRFVPYRPQSINTLAFSHRPNPKQASPRDLRLALGRENGDIEIWNPFGGHWVQEKILRGSRDRTIEQLAWTQDLVVDETDASNPVQVGLLRLFSSGGSPSITEWDLVTGQQKRQAQGNVGDIWCFAAQPQWQHSGQDLDLSKIAAAPSQLLAAGCSDGSVILFTTADDSLQFLRVLSPKPSKKTKVISITWRDRNTVLAGYENGVIRVIDVPSRTVTRSMSLGKAADGSVCVVWTLKCLSDGTILSGDSSGELKIWDARTLTLTQRLEAHEADILDIATSANGNTIFTVGVDRRVVAFKQTRVQSGHKREKWQRTMHRRFHQHDVKAIAAFESKSLSVLVSGGMDTVPIVMSLQNWETEYHRSLSHLPQKPQMSCSSKARLMLTWWDRDLLIWHVPVSSKAVDAGLDDLDQANHQLLTKIELKGDENITSAQISEDGNMIVAATVSGVKLFQIRKRMEAGDFEVRTRSIDLPTGVRAFGASTVGFSPNSKWLFAVRTSGLITMVKILPGVSVKDRPQLHQQVIKLGRKCRNDQRSRSSKLGEYLNTINCLAFSTDSRILAAGDLSGAIDTWILEGHEDTQDVTQSLNGLEAGSSSDSDSDSDSDEESDSRVIHGQKWIRNTSGAGLPLLDSAVLVLSFKPQASVSRAPDSALGLHATRHNPHPVSHELPLPDTKLVAVTLSHQIIEFDIISNKLSDWSKRNPSTYLPLSFVQIKDRVMGVFWDCDHASKKQRLWLYGPTWLFMLDMAQDLVTVDSQNAVGQIGDYDVHEPSSVGAGTKRLAAKSTPLTIGKRRKRNHGAGDQKRGIDAMNATITGVNGDNMDIDARLPSPVSDDDIDTEMPNAEALTQLRRRADPNQRDDDDSNEPPVLDADEIQSDEIRPPAHHAIFRYRSIFGISALGTQLPAASADMTDNGDTANTANPTSEKLLSNNSPSLEIVLVERPMYDVGLLPRFDGGQDWTT